MSSPKTSSPLATRSPKPAPAQLPSGSASPATKPAGGKVDKAAAKAAKQAKRAAAKGTTTEGGAAPGTAAPGTPPVLGAVDKGKTRGGATGAAAGPATGGAGGVGAGGKGAAQSTVTAANKVDAGAAGGSSDPLQPFLHLDLPAPSSSLSHSTKASTANIHPSIIRLALQYAEFKVVGSNARCIAMLEALKDVRSAP